jgi:23S rRNA (uracil1939-C5)-methyltransferase
MVEAVIEKLVHGGQGLGTLEDGRKAFVWNALPGEKVNLEVRKSKNKYLEGVATEIIESSNERIEPRDEAFLSTSPWQIMTLAAENKYKQEILAETLSREHVTYDAEIAFHTDNREWHYRNKMEYSFWGDDEGLHLALFHRASHGKRIITGSSIAMAVIDDAANKIVQTLNRHGIRASQLKTVVVRANQQGEAVVALFVKDEKFPVLRELENVCRGCVVYFSNPKSPASIVTKELYKYGHILITDTLLDVPITYDVNSFFQVNLPIFEEAAQRIKDFVAGEPEVVDMYAGTGTLALLTDATKMVEIDAQNVEMARVNAEGKNLEIVLAPTESAVEYITPKTTIIFDPPRAGLHPKVTAQIREVLPPKIAYLSCNPITQARDLALLQDFYEIQSIEGYNFFPRTPHIESLALLVRR